MDSVRGFCASSDIRKVSAASSWACNLGYFLQVASLHCLVDLAECSTLSTWRVLVRSLIFT